MGAVRAPPVPGGGGAAAAPPPAPDGPASQLAGLFAGGMPTLKKTGARESNRKPMRVLTTSWRIDPLLCAESAKSSKSTTTT